eukprot:jgi/Psemu1/322467/estExt_fgenesh1_pg.C_290050
MTDTGDLDVATEVDATADNVRSEDKTDDENGTATTTSSDDDADADAEVDVGVDTNIDTKGGPESPTKGAAPTDSGAAEVEGKAETEQPTDEELSSTPGSSDDWPDDEPAPATAAAASSSSKTDAANETTAGTENPVAATPDTDAPDEKEKEIPEDGIDGQEPEQETEAKNGRVERGVEGTTEKDAAEAVPEEEEQQPQTEPEATADAEDITAEAADESVAVPEEVHQPQTEPEATTDAEDITAEAADEAEAVPEEVQQPQEPEPEATTDAEGIQAKAADEPETAPEATPLPPTMVRPGLAEAPTDEINHPFGSENTDAASDSTDKVSNVDNSFSELEDPKDDTAEPPSPPAEPKPPVVTPRSSGLSFAEAFGGKKKQTTPRVTPSPSLSAPKTPSDLSVLSPSESQTSLSIPELGHTASSHSALSASRNKKASELISKYQEKVAHEQKPGDVVPLKSSSTHSRTGSFSTYSPAPERGIVRQTIDTESVESEHLPDMNSVRAMFEKTAQNSTKNFEFGESFRQKQRFDQLSDKQREFEAKIVMRGFNEKDLTEGRTASGEIDTSNLPKSFTFEMCSPQGIVPNDGVCRVDYKAADYYAKVFVLHKTKGMLLLRSKTPRPSSKGGSKRKKKTVPGGMIKEEEFLAAAKESGSASVQLQIAAREAAARELYETTGLDVRQQAERFKPAVLCANPKTKTDRGFQYLRNENDNKLYYFLQVDDEDFDKLKKAHAADGKASATKLMKPTVDSDDDSEPPGKSKTGKKSKKTRSQDPGDDPLELRLSSDYSSFEFIHDPVIASKVLQQDKSDASTALNMIMTSASHELKTGSDLSSAASDVPDAKTTVHLRKSSVDDDKDKNKNDETQPDSGNVRVVGTPEDSKNATSSTGVAGKSTDVKLENAFYDEEAKLNTKTSNDTAEDIVAVSCCCSFW